MREVIQQVIASEKEAKRLIQEARIEAERILSEARKQAQELVAQKRKEAQAEVARLTEAAAQATQREKQQRLDRAAAEINAQIQLEEPTRRRAIEAVVRCVCG